MRCMLLCVLKAVEGGLYLLEALEVPEVMRRVLLCMLEGELYLLEVLGGVGDARGAGGDALCAILYAGGCGG